MLDTRETNQRLHRPVSPARHRRRRTRPADVLAAVRPNAVALTSLAGVVLLWVVGFAEVEPRQMGRFGLLSEFNSATVAALLLLLGSTLVCIYQARPDWVVGAHLVTFLALIHGTPALLYGTVRYAWSYKHLGVVEYIGRTGTVDPGIEINTIYHNWPGVFAATAFLSGLAGDGAGSSEAAFAIALWAPLGFNLLLLMVLRYVFRGLTARAAVVWLALLLYFTMTWVGQDYFSPQAVASVLYLAAMGVLLHRPRGGPGRTVLFTVLVAAMAVTHQITLLILVISVLALVLTRRVRGWYLPVLVVVIVSTWALTFAYEYTTYNLEELISGLGTPISNADATFDKSEGATTAQQVVIWGDRFTVAAGAALALLGVWRTRREGTLKWTAVVLMLAPVTVMGFMSFGGEALLRVFLFSAPFMAFLAAEACAPRTGVIGIDARRLWLAVLALVLVFPGYLLGYYGKERQYQFTPEEVAASQWVADNAPPNSILVEGDTNYPRQFRHYEKFASVAIAREPSSERLLGAPAVVLQNWLSNALYTDGYVIITRSQKIGAEMDHSLPPGALTRVEQELEASPLFETVYRSRDASVFTLSEEGRR